MIHSDLYDDLLRVAKGQVQKWGDSALISAGDLTQELCVYFLERPNEITYLLQMEDPDKKIRGLCNQIMSDLVDKYEDTIFYSTDDVRGYLKDGILSDPSQFPNMVQLDLCDGIESLLRRNKRYLDVIIERYVDGVTHPDTKLVTRSVDALTEEMNRAHNRKEFEYDDGPGSRRVVSNSASQALTSNQWNG